MDCCCSLCRFCKRHHYLGERKATRGGGLRRGRRKGRRRERRDEHVKETQEMGSLIVQQLSTSERLCPGIHHKFFVVFRWQHLVCTRRSLMNICCWIKSVLPGWVPLHCGSWELRAVIRAHHVPSLAIQRSGCRVPPLCRASLGNASLEPYLLLEMLST